MMSVLSRYDSSDRESSSAMASSKACLARWHARSIRATLAMILQLFWYDDRIAA